MTLALGMILIMGVASRARRDGASATSYRVLAQQLAPYLRPGCIVGSYRHNVHSIPFYTGFREALVSYRGELAPFSDSPDAAASFINSDDDLRSLWSSHECFALVANRKDLPALANPHARTGYRRMRRKEGRAGQHTAPTGSACLLMFLTTSECFRGQALGLMRGKL